MMELHVHENSPFTPLLNRMTRVRSSLILVSLSCRVLTMPYLPSFFAFVQFLLDFL